MDLEVWTPTDPPQSSPYPLAAQRANHTRSVVQVGHVAFGGPAPVVIAGPCSVESQAQLMHTAEAVAAAGAHMLRGGAFKPRTSPYAFRGLGAVGLRLLAQAGAHTGLPIVTEVLAPGDVALVAEHADMLQIGARNMHNVALLEAAGRSGKPVLLKRGLAATIEEWLLAAEYVLATGNEQVVLCERGIRTFETATRNTLDLNAVALIKHCSHLPVIVDPSHGTGAWHLVAPLALAGLAAGADGLMIEVHHDPAHAASDGPQSLTHANFARLMQQINQRAVAAPAPARLAQGVGQ